MAARYEVSALRGVYGPASPAAWLLVSYKTLAAKNYGQALKRHNSFVQVNCIVIHRKIKQCCVRGPARIY